MALKEAYQFDLEKFAKKFEEKKDERLYEKEDFNETRLCLLKMYHSNIQTHAGYLIGIIIGSLTLFSRLDTFFGKSAVSPYSNVFFWFLLWLIIVALIWVVLRILYWNSYAGHTLGMTSKNVLENFNLYNRKLKERGKHYFKEDEIPPLTVVFQSAIDKEHEGIDRKVGFPTRMAASTAKNSLYFLLIALIAGLVMIVIGLLVNLIIFTFFV